MFCCFKGIFKELKIGKPYSALIQFTQKLSEVELAYYIEENLSKMWKPLESDEREEKEPIPVNGQHWKGLTINETFDY